LDNISRETKPIGPILRTSTAQALISLIRNPLDALPPSIFTEPLVFAKTAGDVKVGSRIRFWCTKPWSRTPTLSAKVTRYAVLLVQLLDRVF
jgi:hypothetical protein